MKSYTVEFKKFGNDVKQFVYDVVSDGIMPEIPHRFFIKVDGTRVEVPTAEMIFVFGKERTELAKEMAKEQQQ